MRKDLIITSCAAFLVYCVVFVNHVDGYVRDPGPRYPPTHGAVWPKPQNQILSDNYLVVRPALFNFKVLDQDCQLLQDALKRYSRIISNAAMLRKIALFGKGPRNRIVGTNPDPKLLGNLDNLDVLLTSPCEDLPHTGMDEQYTLTVDTSPINATLTSHSIWGILRGLETFTQLIYFPKDDNSLVINGTSITDFPRFSYRGLMLDTSRHFLPVFSILQMIDAMSYNKMNVFHWHLTDDESFPYQSITFPDLSKYGAYHSTFVYTPADVQQVIEYARVRGIRVMPEFDTPGHTRSWGEGYINLLTPCYEKGQPDGHYGPIDPTRETTYTFLGDFFKEIVNVFPDPYLHLGGDEVEFECWQSNPNITEYMNKNNITSYYKLEEIYIQRLVDQVDKLNASSVVWEEVFSNGVALPPQTIVHIWKTGYKKVLAEVTSKNYTALLSACWYLDHLSSGGDWQKYYKCEPYDFNGSEAQKELVLGGEACMWAEVVDSTNVATRIWPRASAVAERLWSAKSITDSEEAAYRLEEHACRMVKRGIPAQPPNGAGFCV